MTKLQGAPGGAVSIDFRYDGRSCKATVPFFVNGMTVELEDTGEKVTIRKAGNKYVATPAQD